MAQNPDPSLLDPGQIIKRAFDGTNDRIRVETEIATVNIGGQQEIVISAEHDDIAIKSSSSGNELEPNADGSLNTYTQNILVEEKWDAVLGTYPNATTEVYAYKLGGLSGTTVATVTIIYTDANKNDIISLVKS